MGKSFGEFLRKLRKDRNMTLRDVEATQRDTTRKADEVANESNAI